MTPDLPALLSLYQAREPLYQEYASLLSRWQKSVNLVSRGTLPELIQRHFLDSLQLAFYIPSQTEALIVDLGSGAGFPGLVLSIAGYPSVWLIEADRKKALFLNTVIQHLRLKAHVLCDRIENAGALQADYCVSRALAPLDTCVALAYPLLSPHSVCLFHKGKGVKKEVESFQEAWYGQLDLLPSLLHEESFIVRLSHVSPRC